MQRSQDPERTKEIPSPFIRIRRIRRGRDNNGPLYLSARCVMHPFNSPYTRYNVYKIWRVRTRAFGSAAEATCVETCVVVSHTRATRVLPAFPYRADDAFN